MFFPTQEPELCWHDAFGGSGAKSGLLARFTAYSYDVKIKAADEDLELLLGYIRVGRRSVS